MHYLDLQKIQNKYFQTDILFFRGQARFSFLTQHVSKSCFRKKQIWKLSNKSTVRHLLPVQVFFIKSNCLIWPYCYSKYFVLKELAWKNLWKRYTVYNWVLFSVPVRYLKITIEKRRLHFFWHHQGVKQIHSHPTYYILLKFP